MIYLQTSAMNPLQKVLAALLGVSFLAVGIMFSVVIIPVIAVIGLAGFGYFYWKTRALRKAMRQAVQEHQVIEGEAVVIHEAHRIHQPDQS